jgi:intracellular sulfur oxidation DsrE/DsrF family protein
MLSKSKLLVLLSVLTGLMLTACQSMDGGTGQEKVVYHVNDSDSATAALRNVGNHLDATDGKAKIVVVTHAKGIDFLLDGAQDKNGNPYSIPVEKLKERGVDFRVCAITLKTRKIDPKRVIPEARIVPSGVAEIGKLQTREGYVYLKP